MLFVVFYDITRLNKRRVSNNFEIFQSDRGARKKQIQKKWKQTYK